MNNIISSLLLILASFTAVSQKQSNVLDWKSDVTVNTWLLERMHAQYAERKIVFDKALRSKQATLNYIASQRNKFKQLIGDLPPRCALNPILTGLIQQDGYHIEKIIF